MSGMQQMFLARSARQVQFTLIAGIDGFDTTIGYVGIGTFQFGSISPSTLEGQAIYIVSDNVPADCDVWIQGNLAQNFFETITINGVTRRSADAAYRYEPGFGATVWEWGGINGLVNGVSYPMSFGIL